MTKGEGDALFRFWRSMRPVLAFPYELAGRARWTEEGVIAADHIQTDSTTAGSFAISGRVVEEIQSQAAPYYFHTHPTKGGPSAVWPSPEDIVSWVPLFDRRPDAMDLIVTPAGLVCATQESPPHTPTDVGTQMRLYRELCGVSQGSDGFLEFPGRVWSWDELRNHLHAEYGWDVRYISRYPLPSEPIPMQARDDFWGDLYRLTRRRSPDETGK